MIGSLLRRLFGLERPPSGSTQRSDREETAAGPLPETPPFLQREPLLNRQQRIAGYLFSIRHPRGQRHWQASSEQFFDRVLIERLAGLDLAALTGRRPFLVSIQPESLLLDDLDALASAGAILNLTEGPVADPHRNAVLARAASLRERGALLACPHGLAGSPVAPLLEIAAYITVEAGRMTPPDLLVLTRQLHKDHPDAKLVATGVDSVELFDACRQLPFDFYLGRYLTARREGQEPRLNSQRMVVSQLISHLRRKETDYDKLVLIARQDLALTFRLLRYINSAAMGLSTKIGSLKQAMVYIGREGLYRWLTLLLFYNSKNSPTDDALRETSLGRARMCELLARRRMGNAECEQAFVTGLLSLVDVLFRMPMEQALGQLDLPPDIHEALARHEGKYGTLLALALACEAGDAAAIGRAGSALGLDHDEVNSLYLQALGWAVEYDLGLEEGAPPAA
jgi:EAL and modified HD-GYP domain-containing signal transduction protein